MSNSTADRIKSWKMQLHTLTIVGVGLIGGSIGLATKKRGLAQHVVGVGRDAAKLDEARVRGAIDEGTVSLADGLNDADLVIFCTPVDRIVEQIKKVPEFCDHGAIISDAGSTKSAIVHAIEADLPSHVSFVGGHPLAGSEKKGVEHADADLFLNRWTVLTPTKRTQPDALETVRSFWVALGARVRTMSPEDHDEALALTSHLPHLVAAALAGILPEELRDLTATGFKDTTRVAGGDPEVWTPIFQQNRTAVLASLDRLEDRLHGFRQALANDDVAMIDQLLAQGRKVRDALGS
jgi:prephenate dehydrogenase